MVTLLNTILILIFFQNCVEANRYNGGDNNAPHFRIYNGQNATVGQFPYQVAIKQELPDQHALKYVTFCGGSIISEKKVLSAAHCFADVKTFWEFIFKVPAWRKLRPIKDVYIVAGTLSNEVTISPEIRKNFTDFDVHNINTEQWRRVRKVTILDKQDHIKLDVAVVILKNAYTFDDKYVAPIPLATAKKEYSGLKCLASGFGLTNKNTKTLALSLQWVELTIVPSKQCSKLYYADMKKYVCTESKVSDIRPGDSGGPLVCFETGEPKEGKKGILVGIACAIAAGKPSLYTRVTDYLDLINK